MEIIFLGTGGGRVNLIKQWRATGGFRINSTSANIHVDPGPGALLQSIKYKQDVLKLDCIIVTHFHIDHCNDAAVLIEAMTHYALKKRGILIGSKYTINGDANGDRAISKYHLSKPAVVYAAQFGERKKFKTEKGEFEIEIIKTKHDEPTAFGFKLWIDANVIGYTGDTEYSTEIAKKFSGCDYLIVNCLKPTSDGIPDHLKTADVIEMLKIAKPKFAILSHMGVKILHAGPEKEAALIEKETGVPCVAARDGQKFGEGLERYF
jgi:ribonuclease BN (tRNA processing enzyme)